MAKYIMQLTQTKTFNCADSCFDTLLTAIEEAGKDGYRLTKIKGNNYYFKNHSDEKRHITILKTKDES